MAKKFAMVIQWSDEDNAFLVTLPEFGNAHTHGDTYEEAARNGSEVLDLLIELHQSNRTPLPQPRALALA